MTEYVLLVSIYASSQQNHQCHSELVSESRKANYWVNNKK